jgi:hypothetical protein
MGYLIVDQMLACEYHKSEVGRLEEPRLGELPCQGYLTTDTQPVQRFFTNSLEKLRQQIFHLLCFRNYN